MTTDIFSASRHAGHLEVWGRKINHKNWTLDAKAKNLVVDDGLDLIRNKLYATTQQAIITHGGVGSGTTPPAAGSSALTSEIIRKAFDDVNVDTSKQTRFEFSLAFDEGNSPGTISEAGLFTAASAGIMYAMVTFANLTKDDDIERLFRWISAHADA